MLEIVLTNEESYDEKNQIFIPPQSFKLQLEHSLVSLSKWESEFEKPFLEQVDKTSDEVLGYIKAMTLTSDVSEDVWSKLTEENIQQIHEYIDAKMTATTVYELHETPKTKKEIITAEVIYYWMVIFNIPFECQYWHLNRLFTLVRVCSAKAEKPKKMSRAEIMRRNKELNSQRRKQLGTKG